MRFGGDAGRGATLQPPSRAPRASPDHTGVHPGHRQPASLRCWSGSRTGFPNPNTGPRSPRLPTHPRQRGNWGGGHALGAGGQGGQEGAGRGQALECLVRRRVPAWGGGSSAVWIGLCYIRHRGRSRGRRGLQVAVADWGQSRGRLPTRLSFGAHPLCDMPPPGPTPTQRQTPGAPSNPAPLGLPANGKIQRH